MVCNRISRPAVTALLLSALTAQPSAAQGDPARDFQRYLELWGGLVHTLGAASPEACATGADTARAWADRHLREIVEIEKRLTEAAGSDDPLAALDSASADALGNQFFDVFEQWLDWGFACIESGPAIAAGEYVDRMRSDLETEIFGAPQTVGGLEQDLAAMETPRGQAVQLVADGEQLAITGNVAEAIDAFRQANAIDPTFDVPAESWNRLCWFGALWEHAAAVMFACDLAVERSGGLAWIIDSRGVARAMTGNVDGAVADFETYVASGDASPADVEDREAWIRALRAGENPFTPEVLARLRSQ